MAIEIATVLALALVTAPRFGLAAGPGLDPSWQAALHMAARQDLAYGRDIAFTYGPLGFLTIPRLYSAWTAGLAVAFTFGVHLTTTWVVLRATRRSLTWIGAVAATYVLMLLLAALAASEEVLVPFFVVCVMVSLGRVSERLARHAPWMLGAVAGMHLLVKLNTGLVMGLLAAIALAPGWTGLPRRAVGFGTAAIGAAAAAWLVTGQSLKDLLPYLLHGLDASSGYSAAMVVEEAGRGYEYRLALVCALVLLALAGAALWPTDGRRVRLDRSVGAVALVALLLFAVFKHGFVRHDGHAAIFFTVVAGCAVAFPLRLTFRPVLIAALAFLVSAGFQANGADAASAVVSPAPRQFLSQIATLVTPSRRQAMLRSSREQMRTAYALHPETVRLLASGGVHVEPWETALVWAYGLPWKPAPAFQSYSAYTPQLDRLNADHFSDRERPRWVVREQIRVSVDSRDTDFEAPQATLALLCHYRQVGIDGRWQILERAPNRCGPPKVIGHAPLREGVPVSVPADQQSIVLARIRFEGSLLSRLRTLLYRAPEAYIVIDDQRYRLVTDTAQDGLLMRAPVDRLGLDPSFGLTPQTGSLFVDETPGGLRGSVEFVAIPVQS